MRFPHSRSRQPEQIAQIHSSMRATDKPLQPADIHSHLVLVPIRARLQHLRAHQVASARLPEQSERVDREARSAHPQDG